VWALLQYCLLSGRCLSDVMQCFVNFIRSLPHVTKLGGTDSGTGSISLPEDGNMKFLRLRGLLGTPDDGQNPGT
jgi:hypothetical protein